MQEAINNQMDSLRRVIGVLPDQPGVYQFLDEKGNIIYIGKAKNLKKRVSSYFNRNRFENNKLKLLVRRIAKIKHIVVENESDAFLLENNLIKKHQPRYNVQLKDDKSFPWICVKKEPFPRIFQTRNLKNDGSTYYGPYTSVVMVRTLLDLIRQLFPLRNCNLNLTEENIGAGKFRVCLEYHLGNCLGPCVGYQDEANYNDSVKQIHQILKGNINHVTAHLKGLMKKYSDEFEFEQAQKVKEKLEMLRKYQSRSTIVNPKINNIDVYSISEEKDHAYVNYLKVIRGAIVQAHNLEIRKKLNETREELLAMAIIEIRNRIPTQAREIIVPTKVDLGMPHIHQILPARGDKKKLLELSLRNARHYQTEQRKQKDSAAAASPASRILNRVKEDLRLTDTPVHIECFDNSNIQGKEAVASCVVFRNAKPSKKEYRHFHIKTVTGADDYASMYEIITRRYKRQLKEKKDLPQLVITDGGKGQLGVAVESLKKLGLWGRVAIIGIAKKLEEIYFPGDSVPIYIDKNSETLKLIRNIRNEAHRFGINFHRDERSRKMTQSILDQVPGIGEQSKRKLLARYHGVDKILKEDPVVLGSLIGARRAEQLISYLRRNWQG